MKIPFIFFNLIICYTIIGLMPLNMTNEYEIRERDCPETQESDILLIHGFLTSPDLEVQRGESNINHHYTFDKSELEKEHTDSYRKYWSERGVKVVSDSELCKKITETLNDVNHIKKTLEEYTRIYYYVDNKYVILYRPRQKRAIIQSGHTPIQIIDEDFTILSDYKM